MKYTRLILDFNDLLMVLEYELLTAINVIIGKTITQNNKRVMKEAPY